MRGYQKKVVCLKNTGSDLFEEAYFILKSTDEEGSFEKRQEILIKEASRIIEDSLCNGEKRKKRAIPASISLYAAGFLSAALIITVLILVI